MSFDLKEIYAPIEKELNRVEEGLKLQFNNNGTLLSYINDYIFGIPGKMLRPALTLLSAKTISQKVREEVINFAVAVELIHAATLVHDDILDGAITRRGQKSVNGKWGNHIAVLVGDNLYAKGFSLLSESTNGKILNLLSKTVEKMCEGEGEQAKHKFNFNIEEETYLKIIGNKTAQFMSICCESGALLNCGDEKTVSALKIYGFNLGMAYQIVDDCADLEKDLTNGEITLPIIHLLKIIPDAERKEIIENVARGLVPRLNEYPMIDYVLEKADEYIAQAKKDLIEINDSLSRGSLMVLTEYIRKLGQTKVMASV